MTEARSFKVKSPLSRQLHEPGGRSVRDAERLAGQALDGHREQVMASIGATVTELEAICAGRQPGAGAQVYALASALVDLAGFFDTGPLYEAAYSLCEVTDRMLVADAWDWPSAHVHARALQLILADGCRKTQASDHLLAGLRAVAARSRPAED